MDGDVARVSLLKRSLSRSHPRPEEIKQAWQGMNNCCQGDVDEDSVDYERLWSLVLRTVLITVLADLILKTFPYDLMVTIASSLAHCYHRIHIHSGHVGHKRVYRPMLLIQLSTGGLEGLD